MSYPQMPPIPVPAELLNQADQSKPLSYEQADNMIKTFGAALWLMFIQDPRIKDLVDAQMDREPDGYSSGFTFAVRLKPPVIEPDAIEPIR